MKVTVLMLHGVFRFVWNQRDYLEKLYIWLFIILVDTDIKRFLLKDAIFKMTTFCFLSIFYSYDKEGEGGECEHGVHSS